MRRVGPLRLQHPDAGLQMRLAPRVGTIAN